ncbi:MAG: hypothetical protein U0Q18_33925 [Bryobacteraceae bacterium]
MGELFRIDDALDAINQKLIRRHPHVFGDEVARNAGDVRRIWGEVKAEEKKQKERSWRNPRLRPARAPPALVEAQQLTSRAAQVGFDWTNAGQVLEKLNEELAEFEEARNGVSQYEELEGELGDMLFVLVNLARHVNRPSAKPTRSSAAASAISSAAWLSRASPPESTTSMKWRLCGRSPSDDRRPGPHRAPAAGRSGRFAENRLGL